MARYQTRKLRMALVRSYPAKGDLRANAERLQSILADLAPQRPDVVITPECWLDGYVVTRSDVTRASLRRWAVDADSPWVRPVAEWAARHRCWVILGCTRPVRGGCMNSALIFNRHGRLAGIYDKLHLNGPDRKFIRGRALPVFRGDFGKFGVMICADRRRPETARSLALGGALVIFNPTYGATDEQNLWLMRTRSFESEVAIAMAHPGQSLITDAEGQVVVNEVAAMPAFSVGEVNLQLVRAVRAAHNSFLRRRRPDVYRR
ncbi:MAG: carbon-nitrogen hydrolase family protein [Opitutaceae bacterium]|nr:carbon-nitrogen hydrolase family protein [Opitutaceae bacterium]